MSTEEVTVRFTVKDLCARETSYAINGEMNTLGQLRSELLRLWDIPLELQTLCCAGRTYSSRDHDSTPIVEILEGTMQGPMQQRLVWILWMMDEDYYIVRAKPWSTLCLVDEWPEKERSGGGPVYAVLTLCALKHLWEDLKDKATAAFTSQPRVAEPPQLEILPGDYWF